MCSRLFSMQLQFWSAWNGIINLAGGHVWVVAVGQGEKLRLWVVADVGEVVGLQSFWGVSNKETENFFLFFFNRLEWDFAEVQSLINNVDRERENLKAFRNLRNINSQITQNIPNKGCFWESSRFAQKAGQQMQKHEQNRKFKWIITQVSTEKQLKFRGVNQCLFLDPTVKLWTIPLLFLTQVKINFRL